MTIGVDLGATQIRAAICQGDVLISKRNTILKNKDSLDLTLDQISDFLRPLVDTGTMSIGIGVPAIVDVPSGTVFNSNNISSWGCVPLKSILEKRLNVPVYVNNDANCFAYGAYKYELKREFSNVVGITLGTGLGTGLILNGKPYFGVNCGAGEIGMMAYKGGTIEDYTGSKFFLREYGITAKEANKYSNEYQNVWDEYGTHIGELVKTVVLAYDPQIIVFGGSISMAFELFGPAMNQVLNELKFVNSVAKLEIRTIKQANIGILGAAAIWEYYHTTP